MSKSNLFLSSSLALLLTGAATLSAEILPPSATQDKQVDFVKGEAGKVVVETVEITAIVEGVNIKEKKLTLLGSDGKTFSVTIGDLVDVSSIKKGDLLKTTLTDELVISVHSADEKISKSTANSVVVKAKIIALNKAKHTATLEFTDGKKKEVSVRHDIDMSKHKVGEVVVFQMTEKMAVRIEKAKK